MRAKPEFRTEAIAGLTTFFTMAYIVVVNPTILSAAGMNFNGVLTATVLLAFSMTLFMGLYARLPFAVAPGMGINAFFTYTLVLGHGVPWPVALGAIFWAGVFFVAISLTPLRVAIARAIPPSLRIAAAAGIGIFLSFIGLKNAGLVVPNAATFVSFGKLDERALLSLLGALLIVWAMKKRSPLAFLFGIFGVTLASWLLGLVKAPESSVALPDFSSVFLKFDMMASLKLTLLPSIVAIAFTDLFDSISTFMGVSKSAGMVDEHDQPLRLKEGLIVDAFATLTAGLLGTSSGTAYIESSAGIEMGGRTGMTSVVTALCFLPCLFVAPLVAMVPAYATAPVLVIVGVFMFRSVTHLSFTKMEEALPAFLTIILIPLTFSITQGILWGLLSHTVLYVLAGRRREVPPMLYALALASVALLVIEQRA